MRACRAWWSSGAYRRVSSRPTTACCPPADRATCIWRRSRRSGPRYCSTDARPCARSSIRRYAAFCRRRSSYRCYPYRRSWSPCPLNPQRTTDSKRRRSCVPDSPFCPPCRLRSSRLRICRARAGFPTEGRCNPRPSPCRRDPSVRSRNST